MIGAIAGSDELKIFETELIRDMIDYKWQEFANSKHKMFKDDHKSKFESQDVPVNRTKITLFISKSFVVAIRLNHEEVKEKIVDSNLPWTSVYKGPTRM